jgi:hypothetical protein
MSPLSFLKARFGRPVELSAGSVFALGSATRAPEPDCLWRVRQIRQYVGIPHASIEQVATGITKTIAVSALLGDRTFQVVQPNA